MVNPHLVIQRVVELTFGDPFFSIRRPSGSNACPIDGLAKSGSFYARRGWRFPREAAAYCKSLCVSGSTGKLFQQCLCRFATGEQSIRGQCGLEQLNRRFGLPPFAKDLR